MTRLVKLDNESDKEVEVVALDTAASDDDTKLKASGARLKAGKPPSVGADQRYFTST